MNSLDDEDEHRWLKAMMSLPWKELYLPEGICATGHLFHWTLASTSRLLFMYHMISSEEMFFLFLTQAECVFILDSSKLSAVLHVLHAYCCPSCLISTKFVWMSLLVSLSKELNTQQRDNIQNV